MGFLLKIGNHEVDEVSGFLEQAADMIIEGKVIAYPTNSVYGMGGDPLNEHLFHRLCQIKFREETKGFLLLVSDRMEAQKLARFNPVAIKLSEHFWPGQLTLILPKTDSCIIPPRVVGGKETIGLRVPENEVIKKILEILKSKGHLGAIIGTPANYSGEPPSVSGTEVANAFLATGAIDLIIDHGKSKSKLSTTIVDCTDKIPEFLRIGKISRQKIEGYLAREGLP